MTYLIFFLSLIVTVCLHEAGHLFASLLCKVKVKAFCVGFFKPYLHFEWNGIDWRLTPWLIGGYCQIAGETDSEEDGLLIQPYYKKVLIICAGVFVNLCIALICYWINYKNIATGLFVDWIAIKSVFTGNFDDLVNIVVLLKPNLFLMQLSLINITCAILNLIPWPCTDGSFIILYAIYSVWKEKFIPYLKMLVKWGFISINILQVFLVLWMWLK